MGISFSFLEYPAANTLVRANKAHLLNNEQWQKLLYSSNLNQIFGCLAESSYINYFDFKALSNDNNQAYMRDIEHAIHSSNFLLMKKILRYTKGDVKKLIRAILQRYDLLNVKKTLRRLSNSDSSHNLHLDDYDLGTNDLFEPGQLDKIQSLQELGILLSKTYYGNVFRAGLGAFQQNKNLLIFESVLEKAYLLELNAAAQQSSYSEKSAVRQLIGSYIDELTLNMIVRMRYQYQMESEAIFPLLALDACLLLNSKLFWQISKAEDEAQFLEKLKKTRKWSALIGADFKGTILNMKRARVKKCRKIFLQKSMMSKAPLIAIYFLKEQEIAEIIMLMQARRFNINLTPETLVFATARA